MKLMRWQRPELTTWSPFEHLTTLRDEINRLFDAPYGESGGESEFFGWTPAVDLYEDRDSLVVKAELPGMKKEEINLSFQDGVLTVSGERKHEREGQEGETFRSERYFGKFQRSVSLPASVDASKIGATYKDGVLMIELPKAEEAKPKQIQVNVS